MSGERLSAFRMLNSNGHGGQSFCFSTAQFCPLTLFKNSYMTQREVFHATPLSTVLDLILFIICITVLGDDTCPWAGLPKL